MSFNDKTPSDDSRDEARKRRAEELDRIIPGLSGEQIAHGVDRWCFMLGSGTSMDDVERGIFDEFRTGLGYGFGGHSERV
ncbi:hypothetical protein E3T61_03130 [Cryobacterium lactosi]|uniref:Uncharacterized protein n=1 Tax=Cryobacterium lactosi TaxID=1259202 RepID=A0A4R9BYD2_9MICO|nr:hypothetical protein [Cryobacterium lactosi]TFD94006.1 hypothetical protein E3T61_03130 [Cryobacterium lactosi]